jgi:hypothetical protein
VTPQTDVEELRLYLFLKLGSLLNNLVLVLLSNFANTTENTGEFTNGENVMELGGSRQKLLGDSLPDHDSGLNDVLTHVNDVLLVILGLEDSFQNSTINILNGPRGRGSHVQGEEQTLKSVGDVIATTTGMVHSSQELKLVNLLE